MKEPPPQKGGRPLPGKTATAAKLVKITPEQEVVTHLQRVLAEVDRLPLPIGKLGCQFLDCLELTDKIRDKVRSKARELLLKSPGMIPCWHVSEVPQRVLSKGTLKVFETLGGELTPEEFMAACSTSLTALRKALSERNPHLSPDELEHALNRVLVDLISYDSIVRLSRSKGKQLHLNLDGDE